MESGALRLRTLYWPPAFRRRPHATARILFHPPSLHSSSSCRYVVSAAASPSPNHPSPDKILQVVLVSPQIPGNTGSIARTCAASAVGLHLVEPLGFEVDDNKLRRAGLDYWPYPCLHMHMSFFFKIPQFCDLQGSPIGEKRLLAFTKRGKTVHSDFSYKRGDWLVFGSETCGLPAEALLDCDNQSIGGGTIRIPMVETYVRCLNLSVSVGIALYEAARQLNYEQLQSAPAACSSNQHEFMTQDIFA